MPDKRPGPRPPISHGYLALCSWLDIWRSGETLAPWRESARAWRNAVHAGKICTWTGVRLCCGCPCRIARGAVPRARSHNASRAYRLAGPSSCSWIASKIKVCDVIIAEPRRWSVCFGFRLYFYRFSGLLVFCWGRRMLDQEVFIRDELGGPVRVVPIG